MITPHTNSYFNNTNFSNTVRKIILNSEGDNIDIPRNVGDHTITYGYGFTFIRKGRNDQWSIYRYLEDDLRVIGVMLTPTELSSLDPIVNALNQKRYSYADTLIIQYNRAWLTPAISDEDAEALYEVEIGHKKDMILSRFQICLNSNADGLTLYNTLQNTREMASLLSLGYNADTLIGKGLVTALWNGNRAEAWFEIRYGWADNDPTCNIGWAKRRYLEAQVFGLYDDPANIPPADNKLGSNLYS